MYRSLILIFLLFTLSPIIGMENPRTPLKRKSSTEELPPMPDALKKTCTICNRRFNPESLLNLAIAAVQKQSGIAITSSDVAIDYTRLKRWLGVITTLPDECTKRIFDHLFKYWAPTQNQYEDQQKSTCVKYLRGALTVKGAKSETQKSLLEAEGNNAHFFSYYRPLEDGSDHLLDVLTFAQEMRLDPQLQAAQSSCVDATLKKLVENNQRDLIIKLFDCKAQVSGIRALLSHTEKIFAHDFENMNSMLTLLTGKLGYQLYPYHNKEKELCYVMSKEKIPAQEIQRLAESQKVLPVTNRIKATEEILKDILRATEKVEPLERGFGQYL